MRAPLFAFEEPAPYRYVEGFMGKDMVARLLAHAARREADFTPTEVGKGEQGRIAPDVRVSLKLRDFGEVRSELEDRFSSMIEWALKELRMSAIDLARMELELAAHGDGAFYREHIDTIAATPDQTSDRALTGVYYFHRQPKGFSGGELRLYAINQAGDSRRHIDIVPGSDTLLLFPSWAPHEVRPVACPSGAFLDSRFAINCWYHHRRRA